MKVGDGSQPQPQIRKGNNAHANKETGRNSIDLASRDNYEKQHLSFDMRKKLRLRRGLAGDRRFLDKYMDHGDHNTIHNKDFSAYERMPEVNKMAYGALSDSKQKGDVVLGTHIQKQEGNNCGPNSLSAAFSKYGDHIDPNVIARKTTGRFTSPKALMDYTKERGYKPRIISHSDSKDPKGDMMKTIDKALDNKAPVLILGDSQLGKNGKCSLMMHWMNVSGKYKDSKGVKRYIVDNPTEGKKYSYTADQLGKFASNVRFGQDHQVIVVARDSSQLNGLPRENKPSHYRMGEMFSK
ncbi:MAG: hypothetical protein K8T10_19070 [Candidatus Eremiobacteraeota bacterium]|nr:hypothetical protein [Candidatus Eremiobacteraeota bacterium]